MPSENGVRKRGNSNTDGSSGNGSIDTPSSIDSYRTAGANPPRASVAGAVNVMPLPNGEAGNKSQSDQESNVEDDEVDNHTMTRMLQDGAGRLIYIGDASSLSFVQLLRMIVETVIGPTSFSMDPARHMITEAKLSLGLNTPVTYALPEKTTAVMLVDSFFTNVSIFKHCVYRADIARPMDSSRSLMKRPSWRLWINVTPNP